MIKKLENKNSINEEKKESSIENQDGKTTEKKKHEMKDYEKKNLKDLIKYLEDEKKIKNIDKIDVRTLIKYIMQADRGESWKNNKLYALKSYFITLGRKTKLLYNFSNKHAKKIKKDEKDQEQTDAEKENYLTYEELNILLNEHKNYKTLEDMYKYLLLASICTDQPPLRPQVYASLKIINSKSQLNNDDNFLVLDDKKKEWYFYINDDKVSGAESFKDMNRINLHPSYLKIVKETLQKFPRENFFENDFKYKEMKLLNMLQKITGGLKFTFDMARSSYINHWYRANPNASLNNIEELCREMRHSYDTHITHYKKCKEINGNLEKSRLVKNNQNANKENQNTGKDIDKDKTNIDNTKKIIKQNLDEKKEYSEKYEKNMIYDLIYRANKKKETDVTFTLNKDIILKYNVKIDEDGKYIKKKEKKEKIHEVKQLKQPVGQSQFNKRRNDVIRFANKKIDNGQEAHIKPETMLFYNIKYNNIAKKFE